MNSIIIHKIRKKMKQDGITIGKLGSTVRYKRKERNKTLQALSETVDISVSYISKIENNIITPNIETFKGVLETLEINEDLFESSLVMDEWYLKAIKHVVNLKNYKKELKAYILERNDFQAKLIEFCLLINENHYNQATKYISLLISNIEQMSDFEFIVFTLSIVSYHLSDDDYINASKVLLEIKEKYLVNSYVWHWFYKLKYQLSLFQEDFNKSFSSLNEYLKYLFLHNNLIELKTIRDKYISSLSYFLAPSEFEEIEDDYYIRSKRISHVLNNELIDFDVLEKEDLALLLYYDENEMEEEIKKLFPKVEFLDCVFEVFLKEYFEIKYFDKENYFTFLKENLFSTSLINQHYYGLRFIVKQMKKILLKQFKYKEINIINEMLEKNKVIV